MNFTIGGKNYFIPRESYVIDGGSICELGIMSHSTMQMWILGINFFENYYVVFDQENKQVGFAPSISAPSRLADIIAEDKQTLLAQDLELASGDHVLLAITSTLSVLSCALYLHRRRKTAQDTF